MNKFYLFAFALISFGAFGQIKIENVDIETPYLRHGNNFLAKTTACGADTVQYPTAKATAFSSLNVNNSTSAGALGQYYDVPQPLTISGANFYAYKIDQTGGITLNATVSIYTASPVDSLPTGSPLASTVVVVDTSFGGGLLDTLRKTAIFTSPITVTQPIIIVIENNSANGMGLVSNSYTAMDGAQEWLAMVNIGGTWLHSYDINVGGVPYDADVIIEPFVSYDLTASFAHDAGCLSSSQTVNFSNLSSPILENRMYNVAAYQGIPEFSYTYNYGDGSPVENLANPNHAYAAGSYSVMLNDTIYGWSRNCGTDTLISIGDNLSTNYSLTNNGLQKTFTDNSTSNQPITAWLWDFGDGNTSTMQNPSHTYATAGIYTVCLTTTNACGNDSICKFIDASCADPASSYNYSANYLAVSFSDLSTSGNTISSWMWDFGDGNTSTMQNPSHNYATGGTYKVCLTVSDDCGNDSTCNFITVTPNTTGLTTNKINSISVYPNPANNNFTVNCFESPKSVQLISVTGKVVKVISVMQPKMNVDISNIASGVYFVQITFKDGTSSTQKIYKQ